LHVSPKIAATIARLQLHKRVDTTGEAVAAPQIASYRQTDRHTYIQTSIMIITTVVWRFLRRRWKDILKYCCSEWAERQGWMPNIEEDEEAEALQAAEEGYGTITV